MAKAAKLHDHAVACSKTKATSKVCDRYSREFNHLTKMSNLIKDCERFDRTPSRYKLESFNLDMKNFKEYKEFADRLRLQALKEM